MIKHIQIKSKDLLPILADKFKNRDNIYQNTIDKITNKILSFNTKESIKEWIYYISTNIFDIYINNIEDDILEIDTTQWNFKDIDKAYFLYIIINRFHLNNDNNIDINIILIQKKSKNNNINLFVKELLDFNKFLTLEQKRKSNFNIIEELDTIVKNTTIPQTIKNAKRIESITASLLGVKKYKQYHANRNHNEISFKVNNFSAEHIKEITCPLCQQKHKVTFKNFQSLFKLLKNNTYVLQCHHDKSKKYIHSNIIKINLTNFKDQIEQNKINQADFLIYNYAYLSKCAVTK